MLPKDFQTRMADMLQEEADAFFQTYHSSSYQGLRVNTLKIEVETFLKLTTFDLKPVPWCPTGFYYSAQERPGKHPFHSAGLYYIQEPSAMSVVEYLQPQPGEVILDLCAAPGGKSTQIATHMKGEGFLLSNEITPARAKALSENIERLGIKNAIVTNESPERLANRFNAYFDRILVDAPCSGEGMFRKLEEACQDWTLEKVTQCSLIQRDVLDSAAEMLKPGGTMVYSTCTFSKEENEGRIAEFLTEHPEFELMELTHQHGISSGNPDWGNNQKELSYTARLWPHLLQGEGHFVAKLQKRNMDERASQIKAQQGKVDKSSLELFGNFCKENLNLQSLKGTFLSFGDQLYLLPEGAPHLDKLKVVRPGWHLGTSKKGRFEPSHSLALGMKRDDAIRTISFPAESLEIQRYLKGESFMIEQDIKGWTLVCVDDYPIGWGKVSEGQLKNHYPKGLRWM